MASRQASSDHRRYLRQTAFPPFGPDAQRHLGGGEAMIVGVGGLGSWVAELLARAGVGALRLADNDAVDLTNLHRQAMYTSRDAENRVAKVHAAAERIREINPGVRVQATEMRVEQMTLPTLADGVDLVIDGTDNFPTRFLLNDWCVQTGTPWIFAGAVGAEAQVLPILPGRTPCLRCILSEPPAACQDPNCRQAGVLGPVVAAVAAVEAAEAMKILAGRLDLVSPYLQKFDLWSNTAQRVDVSSGPDPDCPCCGEGNLEYLEP